MERWRDGEIERWREGEMERRRDGEMERRRDGEKERRREGEKERWREGERERWREGEKGRREKNKMEEERNRGEKGEEKGRKEGWEEKEWESGYGVTGSAASFLLLAPSADGWAASRLTRWISWELRDPTVIELVQSTGWPWGVSGGRAIACWEGSNCWRCEIRLRSWAMVTLCASEGGQRREDTNVLKVNCLYTYSSVCLCLSVRGLLTV